MDGCSCISTASDSCDSHPSGRETENVYIPGSNWEITVVVPVPETVSSPGWTATVHSPDDGSPLKATLPNDVLQSGWVMSSITGSDKLLMTVNTYVSLSDLQGEPSGLFVVTDIVIFLPISLFAGV